MPKLKFKKEDFQSFLDSLSKVSDSAILHIKDDSIYAIATASDKSLFLWTTMEGDFGLETNLNIPSLNRLSKTMDLIPTSEVELIINSNNLEYKGTTTKFKYHLYGDGILVGPKLTLSKIENLKYEYEFKVSKTLLASILKNSSTFKDTNKLYIFTEDDKMVWSLGDRTRTNTDVLTMIGDDVNFEMDEFIINLDNLRLLNMGNEPYVNFRINKMGIGNIQIQHGKNNLQYILTSLTK